MSAAWNGYSVDYQAALGRVVLASAWLEHVLTFAAHWAAGHHLFPDTERSRLYAELDVAPFEAKVKALENADGEMSDLAVSLRAAWAKRSLAIHGHHSEALISLPNRDQKRHWNDQARAMHSPLPALDDLAVQLGFLTEEVAKSISRYSVQS